MISLWVFSGSDCDKAGGTFFPSNFHNINHLTSNAYPSEYSMTLERRTWLIFA